MSFKSEELANAHARWESHFYNKYTTTFLYKGRWHLTDCYDEATL